MGTMNLNVLVGRTAPHFGELGTARPTLRFGESFRRGGQRAGAGGGDIDSFVQSNREPKRRACAPHASPADGTPHEPDELAARGQSQTGASLFAGGRRI